MYTLCSCFNPSSTFPSLRVQQLLMLWTLTHFRCVTLVSLSCDLLPHLVDHTLQKSFKF